MKELPGKDLTADGRQPRRLGGAQLPCRVSLRFTQPTGLMPSGGVRGFEHHCLRRKLSIKHIIPHLTNNFTQYFFSSNKPCVAIALQQDSIDISRVTHYLCSPNQRQTSKFFS